jgi:hypothetical protein
MATSSRFSSAATQARGDEETRKRPRARDVDDAQVVKRGRSPGGHAQRRGSSHATTNVSRRVARECAANYAVDLKFAAVTADSQ